MTLLRVSIRDGIVEDNRFEWYPNYFIRRDEDGTREYYERQTTYGK